MSSTLAKRIFDVTFAAFGLLVLAPFGVILALLVKLTDRGPVFYRQTRIGQFGREFKIYKFRTMILHADQMGALITKDGDPRVTRIGRFLRKSKMDELPQLLNVLFGEMSFVGPRPEVPRYVKHYTPEQRQILDYKPGITDMATMLFRNEEALLAASSDTETFYLKHCLPKKIELNKEYAENANLIQDIGIIVQTLCPYWLGVFALYLCVLTGSLWGSYLLRSDFRFTDADWVEFRRCWLCVVLPPLALLFWRGELRGMLSYFSIPEFQRIGVALGAAFVMQVALCRIILDTLSPTISLLLTNLILSLFGLCGFRMFVRLLREFSTKKPNDAPEKIWRIAIIGTGELATNMVLDLGRRRKLGTRVVAFFDDNPHMWNRRLHDIPVVGMPECLLSPAWQSKIDEAIVTIPEEPGGRYKEISEMLAAMPMKVTFAGTWPILRFGDL